MNGPAPIWLHAISLRHGVPSYDEPTTGCHRWMWADGDLGIRVHRRVNAWEVFGWCPARSAALHSTREPSAADLVATASLAGLCGPHAPVPVGAAKFTPADGLPLQEAS